MAAVGGQECVGAVLLERKTSVCFVSKIDCVVFYYFSKLLIF